MAFCRAQQPSATAALFSPLVMGSAHAQPKKGGTLRVAMAHGNTSDNYDPGSWTHAYVQVFALARHGYLTEVAADGSLVGEVAESWESSPDASVWTFAIRPGIKFHSGKELTPEDVVASLDYHRGDESTSAAKPFVDPITDMTVDGNNVVITLESGNADFPFIMSDYHLPIMPSKDGKVGSVESRRSRRLHRQGVRARRPGKARAQPGLLEIRSRPLRRSRTADHPRPGRPARARYAPATWT